MNQLILGTAGHIDHGKTALVRALTGIDTDRLKEEKKRGITIELGFAELSIGTQRLGVIDVPGHEGFIRSMVAGASGMDLVLFIIAADEGVMPQTREHLSILELLGVKELVVVLTKCDLVDDEWCELVQIEVEELLGNTVYAGAPMVLTSALNEFGLDTLLSRVGEATERLKHRNTEDITRLPLDRAFTIQGTGTVVTGTLWSGVLKKGERVRLLPHDFEANIRSLQVHGSETQDVIAGNRVAVALSAPSSERQLVTRGGTLVSISEWKPTWMLTVQVRLIAETKWRLQHNQRVRVHIGTSEVMARCVLLTNQEIHSGGAGWIQLRLEDPVIARARDPIILRAYSPMVTIGGGVVAEPNPAKRKQLSPLVQDALERILRDEPTISIEALVTIGSWQGVSLNELPITSGLPPTIVDDALRDVLSRGALKTSTRLFSAGIATEAQELILDMVHEGHSEKPFLTNIALPVVRSALPSWASVEIADAVIEQLTQKKVLEREGSGVRCFGYQPKLSSEQQALVSQLREVYHTTGLSSPLVAELPPGLAQNPNIWDLLKFLENADELVLIADGYYVSKDECENATQRVQKLLGGQRGLGPSAFREALPLSRKHLIPMLNYLDGLGITVRRSDGREVPAVES